MTNAEFIDALERQQVIDGDLARQLRAKAAEGGRRVTPEALIKFLVKTSVITQWKGEELTAELLAEPAAPAGRSDEILDLAPIEEDDDNERVERRPRGGKTPIDASSAPPAPSRRQPPPVVEPPLFAPTAGRSGEPSALAELPTEDDRETQRRPPGLYKLGGGKGKGKSNKRRTAAGRNQWDSPLILLGGGVLGLLIVAAALLYFLLFRENAAAVLADANNLFENGAYNQAIERYREFATSYSSHSDASQARVRMEMAKLWQSVEGRADPTASLALAKEVIAAVESEAAFNSDGGEQGLSQAKQELGVLLVRIGDALVERAETSTDGKQVDALIGDIEAVLQLSANTKYVPEKFRNAPALARIEEQLGVIRTRQTRDVRLAATLAAMDAALAAHDTNAAYAARLALLAEFPALADDETLVAKVREASVAEQARVKFVSGDRAAETAWPVRSLVAELTLAERRGPADAGGGEPIVVRIDGALYGLRSSDGALLWRRFAGQGETAAPLIVGGGAVAADLAGGELWRLDAATGKLQWRLPLDDKVTGVITSGNDLLATGASGKLYVINAADGALRGHVDFSQPSLTAPAVNDRGDRIYVVARHSILYTLNASDYACIGVYYLGHADGAVAAPPVAVLNKLIVADNSGTDTTLMRVLSLDENGAVSGEAAGDRLEGLAITPLARTGRRVVVTTTAGQLGVYEIGGGNDQSALTTVARRGGRNAEPLAQFALLHEGKLWLAGRELSKLTVLPTENQLSVEALDNQFRGDAFDAPLVAVGQLILHVRRPKGRPGAIVAATDSAANRLVWETELAVPAAGAPAVDSAQMRVTAATASGAVYVLDRDALTRGVDDKATRAEALIGAPPALTASIDLGGGALAAAAVGADRVLVVQPNDPRQLVRSVTLAAPLAGRIASWLGGVVCPTEIGQVFLVDPATAASMGTPFQPELTPGRKYRWLPPTATSDGDDSQLVITDGDERLYLIRREAEPAPHLELVKSVDVGPAPLTSPLAVVGDRVYAGTNDGRLAPFALPDLAPQELIELDGRVAWGPYRAGDGALVATDAGTLIFVGGDGAIVWDRELPHGELAGEPLVGDGAALLLHAAGGLSSIDLADGKEAGYADIGQPAVAGPVALGERVVVAAPDGALLVVNRP